MILSGWKEISQYLHCSVRTVQRWEVDDLPIYRPASRKRGLVIAHSGELDGWVRGRVLPKYEYASLLLSITNAKRLKGETEARVHRLCEQVGKLREGFAELYARRNGTPTPRTAQDSKLDELAG